MTKDEIIEMAETTQFHVIGERVLSPLIEGSDMLWLLERFAALVAAKASEKEREACAKVCDELRHPYGYSAETQDWVDGTIQSADAIRSRGNSET